MTVRAEVHHHWAVTRGNHPDRKPSYCPLHEPRYNAAVALYQHLLQPVPDTADNYWVHLADMAVVIPADQAVFWYSYSAVIESTWTLTSPDTDQDAVLAAAYAELTTRPDARIIGDHPATTPTTPAPEPRTDTRSLWLATLHDQDPNTPDDIWYRPIFGSDINTHAQARDLYMSMAAQLNEMPGPPEPTTGITLWHCLQATADSPWYTTNQHADPHALATALYDSLTPNQHHCTTPIPPTEQGDSVTPCPKT